MFYNAIENVGLSPFTKKKKKTLITLPCLLKEGELKINVKLQNVPFI